MLRKWHCVGLRNSFAGVGVKMKRIILLFLLLLFSCTPVFAAFDNTHKPWNDLLKQHVHWNATGSATTVNYDGFVKDHSKLAVYLKSISLVSQQEYARWPLSEQQAFLINAYNAYTVELILTRYPKLESIKDLGGVFSSPWKKEFISLLGQKRSLDIIEHSLLRGDKRYKDPRIHFAVNCASIGCPALRDQAYVGNNLGLQLEDQTVRFLSDRSRNRFNANTGVFQTSKIFDWYAEDFDKYANGARAFIARYANKIKLPASEVSTMRQAKFRIEYYDYNWALNKEA